MVISTEKLDKTVFVHSLYLSVQVEGSFLVFKQSLIARGDQRQGLYTIYNITVLYIKLLNLQKFVLRTFLQSPIFLSHYLTYTWALLLLHQQAIIQQEFYQKKKKRIKKSYRATAALLKQYHLKSITLQKCVCVYRNIYKYTFI